MYSNELEKLVKQENIQHKIIRVNSENKNIYITDLIDTFPQIYLKKYNREGNVLFGGYTDLIDFIQKFKQKEIDNTKIKNFIKNKKNWSRKATLRLINLINC